MTQAERDALPVLDDPGPEYVCRSELNALLRRGERTLRDWISAGKLRPVARLKGSNAVLFLRCDAERVNRAMGRHPDAARALAIKSGALPLAAEPTDTLPGTPERIEVYRQRAAANRAIFHPGDRKLGE